MQPQPHLTHARHPAPVRFQVRRHLPCHLYDCGTTAAVVCTAEFPSAGTYRLFFDYSHNGTVRTASFTVDVATGSAADTMTTHQEGH